MLIVSGGTHFILQQKMKDLSWKDIIDECGWQSLYRLNIRKIKIIGMLDEWEIISN